MLYHPKSDHSGVVLDYAHDYERFKGKKLELLSVDTRDGWSTASLYDVTQYPAILILADDGSVQKIWQGLPLPLTNEIDSYTVNSSANFTRSELLSV